MTRILVKLEAYRKFVVALAGNAAAVWGVIEVADLSTKQGVYAAVLGVLGALAVYVAPNEPKKK